MNSPYTPPKTFIEWIKKYSSEKQQRDKALFSMKFHYFKQYGGESGTTHDHRGIVFFHNPVYFVMFCRICELKSNECKCHLKLMK